MYKIKKLISAGRILPLLFVVLLGSGCSLLDESFTSDASSEESTVLSVEEREQQVIVLLTQVEKLITNASNAKDLQLSETKLNEAQAHLKDLPTSYTSLSSRGRSRSSKRSSRRASKYYEVETVHDDKYADLRDKANELHEQLINKQQWLAKNVTHIQVAKQFAFAAAKASQKAPYPVKAWEYIEQLWNKAINELENIDNNEPGYVEAQKLLKTYQNNLKIIQYRVQTEASAAETLDNIYDRVESLAKSQPSDRQAYILELEDIVKDLRTIKSGTTAYTDAQNLLMSVQKRLKS